MKCKPTLWSHSLTLLSVFLLLIVILDTPVLTRSILKVHLTKVPAQRNSERAERHGKIGFLPVIWRIDFRIKVLRLIKRIKYIDTNTRFFIKKLFFHTQTPHAE